MTVECAGEGTRGLATMGYRLVVVTARNAFTERTSTVTWLDEHFGGGDILLLCGTTQLLIWALN